ncbi:hybrid sensor histidine kinase/response regulator [Vibrio penaeicida]|uniref:hybrid sensor histidine kinase/response regulator n=1 Tax=Vibrio penaeicida TaxID=104609 RepID=UPI000CEA700C|nr:response regulator [Vibrio penaeicida]
MKSIRMLFSMLFLIMGIVSVAIFSLNQANTKLHEKTQSLQSQLASFYRLSLELKGSSDHLTKFARAYGATGNEKWKGLFNHVLDVRNGKTPIPKGNQYEYWDIVSMQEQSPSSESAFSGPTLVQRLKDSGIEAFEFSELNNALALSNALVGLEVDAFNAIEGRQQDQNGQWVLTGVGDLDRARSLLYSDQYFSEKAKIMAAISSAHNSILKRLNSEIMANEAAIHSNEQVSLVLFFALIAAIGVSFILLWRLYISPLSKLSQTVVEKVENKDFSFTLTQRAYGDLQYFIDSLNVVFHHISEQLSNNTLVKDFNIVLRNNESTSLLCDRVTHFLMQHFPVEMVGIYIFENNALTRISGSGDGESQSTVIKEESSTLMGVTRSKEPVVIRELNGAFVVPYNGGQLSLNEMYYLPLLVKEKVIAVMEIGVVHSLDDIHLQWLNRMLNDLSISIQLSRNLELQRKAEQKALEQSQLNQQILNATPNPMYCLNNTGEFITINSQFRTLMGLSEEQILGSTPNMIFGETVPEFGEHHPVLFQKESNANYEVQITPANQKQLEMLVYEASFLDSQGHVNGIVGILLDQTERKQMENALVEAKESADAMSQAKGEFLANISHEIRTPMNAIMGMAHLTLNTELDSIQEKYVNRINDSAKNLLGIINDILDFSKIEAGKLDIEHIDFCLDDVLENVVSIVSVKAQEKNLELVLDIDPTMPINLIGDPLRLGQVIVNLCGNAVKFTHEGEIIVKATLDKQDDKNAEIRFVVSDTGEGIPEDKLAKLFEAFTQADASTTRKHGGTGLGLNISKQLVELMGGGLTVTSKVGEGSQFIFTIQCGLQSAKMRDISAPLKPIKERKALVVDDNDTARGIMENLLEAMEFSVTSVTNGYDAIELLNTEQFNMVFADWNMPGINGVELLKRLPRDERFTDLKRFLVTAYGREVGVDEEASPLIDGFILKPVNPSTLLDAIMDAYGIEAKNLVKRNRAKIETPDLSGKRILLVEDNEINQEVAIGLLEKTRCEVTVAENGKIALDALSKENIDIVLMDMQMPIMDGVTATKRAREDGYTLPIVAMTANAMAQDIETCTNAGMNDHVTKPIDVSRLYNVLKQYLNVPVLAEESSVIPSSTSSSKTSPSKTSPSEGSTNTHKSEDIGGVDIDDAAEEIGITQERYLNLLDSMLSNLLKDLKVFREKSELKDWVYIERFAHTVRGSAGNLRISALVEIAERIESNAKEKKAIPTEWVDDMDERASCIQKELLAYTSKYGIKKEAAEFDADVDQVLSQLTVAIEGYDASAVQLAQHLLDASPQNKETLEALVLAIESYDFSMAATLLESFRSQNH